jgi:hypothetical protein
MKNFAFQKGYGAFSVGASQVPQVKSHTLQAKKSIIELKHFRRNILLS